MYDTELLPGNTELGQNVFLKEFDYRIIEFNYGD